VRKRLEGRRRRRIGAVVAVVVVALFGTGVAPASAVPVVDVAVAKEGELGTQAYWLLQTVTATRSGLLTDVGFPSTVNGNGGADGYTVNVRRVQPGQPTPLAGAVIASGVASDRAVTFAEPVSWVAGSVYSFQLVSPRDDDAVVRGRDVRRRVAGYRILLRGTCVERYACVCPAARACTMPRRSASPRHRSGRTCGVHHTAGSTGMTRARTTGTKRSALRQTLTSWPRHPFG
jgi:hypothetical protein